MLAKRHSEWQTSGAGLDDWKSRKEYVVHLLTEFQSLYCARVWERKERRRKLDDDDGDDSYFPETEDDDDGGYDIRDNVGRRRNPPRGSRIDPSNDLI